MKEINEDWQKYKQTLLDICPKDFSLSFDDINEEDLRKAIFYIEYQIKHHKENQNESN